MVRIVSNKTDDGRSAVAVVVVDVVVAETAAAAYVRLRTESNGNMIAQHSIPDVAAHTIRSCIVND
jgi:hypothetical protein